MASINVKTPLKTHQGAVAKNITPVQQLRRCVMSCLLWEKEFYQDGESIFDVIAENIPKVTIEQACEIAIEARHKMNLRHVPLLICSLVSKHHSGSKVSSLIENAITRADELAELIVIHCKVNNVDPSQAKKVMPSQMKKGIAKAFNKFDEYHFAKYNRKGAVRLRDALFLSHAKPVDKKQALVFKRLAEDKLKTPDTWEVSLSSGADKKESFERLLSEGKLGYMALLRNLRNMEAAEVNPELIKAAISERKGADKVLPFRFVSAARHAPRFEPELDAALVANIQDLPKFDGKTLVLVDVSGSMFYSTVSAKSDITRGDAAATLASVINASDLRVFTFSNQLAEVPARKGMAGVDCIIRSQPHGGTDLGGAVRLINENIKHDRLIVITDEQSNSRVPDPICNKAYMINVASNKNGVGYGKWTHIDGFSESVIKYIYEIERT